MVNSEPLISTDGSHSSTDADEQLLKAGSDASEKGFPRQEVMAASTDEGESLDAGIEKYRLKKADSQEIIDEEENGKSTAVFHSSSRIFKLQFFKCCEGPILAMDSLFNCLRMSPSNGSSTFEAMKDCCRYYTGECRENCGAGTKAKDDGGDPHDPPHKYSVCCCCCPDPMARTLTKQIDKQRGQLRCCNCLAFLMYMFLLMWVLNLNTNLDGHVWTHKQESSFCLCPPHGEITGIYEEIVSSVPATNGEPCIYSKPSYACDSATMEEQLDHAEKVPYAKVVFKLAGMSNYLYAHQLTKVVEELRMNPDNPFPICWNNAKPGWDLDVSKSTLTKESGCGDHERSFAAVPTYEDRGMKQTYTNCCLGLILFVSAFMHFGAAIVWRKLYDKYTNPYIDAKREIFFDNSEDHPHEIDVRYGMYCNPFRYMEQFITGAAMVEILSIYSGIYNCYSLVLVCASQAIAAVFGYITEQANRPTDTGDEWDGSIFHRLKYIIMGWYPQSAAYLMISTALAKWEDAAPQRVTWLIQSNIVLVACLSSINLLIYGCGCALFGMKRRPCDYWKGERMYIVLSFLTKFVLFMMMFQGGMIKSTPMDMVVEHRVENVLNAQINDFLNAAE